MQLASTAWTAAFVLLVACSIDRSPLSLKHQSTAGLGGAEADGGGSGSSMDGAAVSGNAGTQGSGVSDGGSGGSDANGIDDPGGDGGPMDGAIDAGPLGYVPGKVGAPCTVDTECRAERVDRICFTESYFAPLLTLPDGYCGKLCDPDLGKPCEDGAACITFPTFPPIFACMRACQVDDDCRVQDGYSCNKPFTSESSVCSLRN